MNGIAVFVLVVMAIIVVWVLDDLAESNRRLDEEIARRQRLGAQLAERIEISRAARAMAEIRAVAVADIRDAKNHAIAELVQAHRGDR